MSHEKLIAAQEKLRDALQGMDEVLAPRMCAHGDYSKCCETEDICDWDDTYPIPGGALLSEFVLVMSWTTMEEGGNFVGIHTAPRQLQSHSNGLLFTALYE
jgi:hypothetical protein